MAVFGVLLLVLLLYGRIEKQRKSAQQQIYEAAFQVWWMRKCPTLSRTAAYYHYGRRRRKF